jgi:hypothetical protein
MPCQPCPVWRCSGSGKTLTLEGGSGQDSRGGSDGDGLVHLCADELFSLLHTKANAVGVCGPRMRSHLLGWMHAW